MHGRHSRARDEATTLPPGFFYVRVGCGPVCSRRLSPPPPTAKDRMSCGSAGARASSCLPWSGSTSSDAAAISCNLRVVACTGTPDGGLHPCVAAVGRLAGPPLVRCAIRAATALRSSACRRTSVLAAKLASGCGPGGAFCPIRTCLIPLDGPATCGRAARDDAWHSTCPHSDKIRVETEQVL